MSPTFPGYGDAADGTEDVGYGDLADGTDDLLDDITLDRWSLTFYPTTNV